MRAPWLWLPVALILAGCATLPPPDPQEESRTVPLAGAELANVRIEMKGGELRVAGGASDLLEALFRYGHPQWKPEVRYDRMGFRGNLIVREAHGTAFSRGGRYRNDWDLKLSDHVPMDLTVNLGAGRSELHLGGLRLRSLEVHLGAGELDLDLAGAWQKSFEARIRGGVGKATVHLPKDIGVEARASGGIGQIRAHGLQRSGHTYTNEAFGKTPVTLRVDVQGGIGEIRLELEG
jgi:hypothetical protein